jgi:hypothetical protein
MAGLVPAISLKWALSRDDRDARVKPAHDAREWKSSRFNLIGMCSSPGVGYFHRKVIRHICWISRALVVPDSGLDRAACLTLRIG